MKPIDLMELLNDLPDEMVDSAAEPYIRRSPMIWYRVSAIAACFAILLTAAVYPKLRIQTPDIREESAVVTETPQSVYLSYNEGSNWTDFAANPNQAPAGPCGYINGRINVSSSTPRTITGTSWTTPGKAIPDIITVKVDVDDYSTGALLFSYGDTKYNTSSVTKARTQAVYVGITATAFGGHTCTKNGVQYVCYTAEYGFSI